jgi:hypothetical protein
MSGYTMLADRVASLLPNTTAGACVPASPWSSTYVTQISGHTCRLVRTCHYSCHGAAVCGAEHVFCP